MSDRDIVVTIDWDRFIEDAEEEFEKFGYAARIALPRAINRTVAGLRTRVSKGIRDGYNIKSSALMSAMSVHRATSSSLYGELAVKGKNISLYEFSPSPKGRTDKRPKKGISVVVNRADGRVVYSGSFYANLPGRGEGIYKRETEARTPIIKLMGPSIPQMTKNTDVMERAELDANQLFYANYRHELTQGHMFRGRHV